MVTRTYCDHCGNVTRNHKVLSFGDIRGHNTMRQLHLQQVIAAQNAQGAQMYGAGGGGGVVTYTPSSPSEPECEIVNVDLCQHCVPLWMNRVKNLTKISDPE